MIGSVLMAVVTATVVCVHAPDKFEVPQARALVAAGITALAGKDDPSVAWRVFCATNDVVGIKVNAQAAPLHGPRRVLIDAIVDGLRAAGVMATNIVVWDRDGQKMQALGLAGSGVIGETGWDAAQFYEHRVVGRLIWGDLLFGQRDAELSTRSHLPKLLTQRITKLINLPALQDHEVVGLSGCLHNLSIGLVDNARRFETRGETALAEINALPAVRGKAVLHVLDGLVGAFAGGPTFKTRHSWPCGRVFFSTDPVAVDTLALELIEAKRREAQIEALGPRASHIGAAARLGLGVADHKLIKLIDPAAQR